MASAKDVAELRARTGAGMMDCKKALDETNGDLDKAVEHLRASGAARTSLGRTKGRHRQLHPPQRQIAVPVSWIGRLRRAHRVFFNSEMDRRARRRCGARRRGQIRCRWRRSSRNAGSSRSRWRRQPEHKPPIGKLSGKSSVL
jgi:hypothetical protein